MDDSGIPDWERRDGALHAVFRTGDFRTGVALVNAFAEAAEAANHHPDITLTYGRVEVSLTSHDAGGVTDRDTGLARVFSALAAELPRT